MKCRMCHLCQFLQDDVGAFSLMRLMAFLAFGIVLGVWIWGNIMAGHYVPLGYSEAGIITAAIAGKAAQARFEYGGPYSHVSTYHSSGESFDTARAKGKGAGPGDSGPAFEKTPSPRDLGEE